MKGAGAWETLTEMVQQGPVSTGMQCEGHELHENRCEQSGPRHTGDNH